MALVGRGTVIVSPGIKVYPRSLRTAALNYVDLLPGDAYPIDRWRYRLFDGLGDYGLSVHLCSRPHAFSELVRVIVGRTAPTSFSAFNRDPTRLEVVHRR
jgi:hypothetical protein